MPWKDILHELGNEYVLIREMLEGESLPEQMQYQVLRTLALIVIIEKQRARERILEEGLKEELKSDRKTVPFPATEEGLLRAEQMIKDALTIKIEPAGAPPITEQLVPVFKPEPFTDYEHFDLDGRLRQIARAFHEGGPDSVVEYPARIYKAMREIKQAFECLGGKKPDANSAGYLCCPYCWVPYKADDIESGEYAHAVCRNELCRYHDEPIPVEEAEGAAINRGISKPKK